MSSRNAVLVGWGLFTVSGVFFLVGSIRERDWLGLGAAITWIVGVALFVYANMHHD